MGKKSRKKAPRQTGLQTYGLRAWIALGMVWWITLVMPLYYENKYFNMLEAKSHVYIAGVCVFVPLICLVWILEDMGRKQRNRRGGQFRLLDGAVLALGACALLSCLLSENIRYAFWGSRGWSVGAFTWATLCIWYFWISRQYKGRAVIWLPVMLLNLAEFLMGICHSANVDVLSMHLGIAPEQLYSYIATIGNLNWYVGYLCILLPAAVVFFLRCKKKAPFWLCMVFLILGFVNVVLCASDGIYLGIGLCLFFAVPYAWKEKRRAFRSGILLVMFGGALLFVRFCPVFAEKRADMGGLSAALLHPAAAAGFIGAGLVICAAAALLYDRLSKRQITGCIAAAELVLGAAALYFILDTIRTFDDSWGTKRGLTWRVSWEMFQDYSLKQKLIGIGPEMLRNYYTELSENFSRKILVAHSEPLQILMTMGIAGLLSWLCIWLFVFYEFFRDKEGREERIAYFLSLTAYLGQSFVNTPQSQNAVLLFLVLGLYRNRILCGKRKMS